MRSKRKGDSKSGLGESCNGSIISRMVSEGTETLPVVYRKVSNKIRSNWSIYGKSGRVRKVMVLEFNADNKIFMCYATPISQGPIY
jgi:hypothetical protein